MKRLFVGIWRALDAVRKTLHLIVLLFMFALIGGALSSSAPQVGDRSALLIQPRGALVEQLEGDPFDRAIAELTGDLEAQTLVRDVVDGLRFAANDSRIRVVVLDLRGMGGAGLSKLRRVSDALTAFRESGKPVIALGDYYSQGAYYLAAHADDVYMHPRGLLLLQGFGAYRNYYREAIDRLKIEWNVFRAGDFKSAVEPFLRNDMSDEDRSSIARLINRLWGHFSDGLMAARDLEDGSIERLQGSLPGLVDANSDGAAGVAVELGFVDALLTRAQVADRVREYAAADDDSPLGFRATGLEDYVAQMRLLEAGNGERQVAIVVAAGEILDGVQPPGTVGGDSTAALLAQARRDDKVRAVVLRVDSPGGSVFASEVIRNEVLALKAAGKPVIASMASVAASGGYWISMSADRILANESTITGSIGVFSMFPTFEDSLGALGVYTDGVATSSIAGALRPDLSMNDDVRALLQALVDDDYARFVGLVSADRELAPDAVQRIAQGQVWTGREALDNGLVDELGDLDEAVAAAADLAGLEEGGFTVRYIEPELSAAQTLVLQLFSAMASLDIDPSVFVARPGLAALADRVEAALGPLTRFNDPRGSYAHCLCGFTTP